MEAVNLEEKPAPRPSEDRPLGWLEVLQRGDKVVQRIPVRGATIHVGRAYDNDLILDDPFVCPHHLSIRWDGERLQVSDLQSLNGVALESGDPAGSPSVLECGDQLRLGRTLLRFRSASFPVAPARRVGNRSVLLDLFERPLWQLAMVLLVIGLFLLNNFLDTTSAYKILKTLPIVAGLLLMVLFWSLLWAFASRIMIHRWNFWCHCSVACAGVLANQLGDTAIAYFTFAFGLDGAFTPLTHGIGFLLIGTILFLHLHFASQAPVRRLLTGAFGMSGVIVGLLVLFQLAQTQEYASGPKYEATLKMPVFKLKTSQSSEAFFAGTGDLLSEVDAEVKKAKQKSAD